MKKGIKKFFLVALPLSMMAMNITSVFADDEFPVDDLENYLEVQSGGEAMRIRKLFPHLMKTTLYKQGDGVNLVIQQYQHINKKMVIIVVQHLFK